MRVALIGQVFQKDAAGNGALDERRRHRHRGRPGEIQVRESLAHRLLVVAQRTVRCRQLESG